LTAHVDIDIRLQNWAEWCREYPRQGSSITGILCDRARRAALGNVWAGHEVRDPIDENDAKLVERAMRTLIKPKRDALKLHYVEGARWQIICRRAHVRVSREHFDMVMRQARDAVEWQVNKEAA
jgi:hypothetical protein